VPILPTRRFIALLAGASVLFLVGTLPALLVDGVLLAGLLFDALRVPRRDRLELERSVDDRIPLGSTSDIVHTIRNLSRRPLELRLTDDVMPPLARSGPPVLAATVAPGRERTLRYTVRAQRRGEAIVGDLHLRLRGPLGLAWVYRRDRRSDRVLVRPGVLEVRRYRLLGLRHRLREAGMRNVRMRGELGAFESLREYVAGDDPRTVDWKATARSTTVMVRRYEVERGQPVVLVIDAGRLMTEQLGDRERIDHALSAALLLADVASHSGDRVGLLVFSDRIHQFIPPARVSLARMSEALSRVEPSMVEPNYPDAFAYLARHLRRRALLVVFTDVIDQGASSALTAHLARATARHLPLLLALRNPALETAAAAPVSDEAGAFRRAAAEELLHARATALAGMRRAGVLVADASPHDAPHAVVNRYLEVKARGRL
jgi:uncharacterized protein (DUF58 family)